MAKLRTGADLVIHAGAYRNFECYWAQDGSMPGLDIYSALPKYLQDDFISSIEHWGSTEIGKRPAQSRINQESEDPLIVAIKAGKHRFTAFREPSGPTWIVVAHYVKEGKKRDKTGDRAIERTIEIRNVYFEHVKNGAYYERG